MTHQMINKLFIKEGIKPLLYLLLATLFFWAFICDFLAVLLALVLLIVAYVYRMPSSSMITMKDNILSPCDGIVTAIDTKGNKQTLYITLRCCDTHLLKAPIDATMTLSSVRHGLHLKCDSFKAKQLNEKRVVKFDKIKIALLSSPFNCTMKIDECKAYEQAKRFGVMIQGEIKVTLPKEVKTTITIGQKLSAGKTVLA